VSGGAGNWASGNYATVSGGAGNTASGPGAFVGGGGYDGYTHSGNTASGAAATISGGLSNQATNNFATVGGGSSNTAGGADATIPGGSGNVARGQGSFVAGVNATDVFNGTNCNNSFVWGDSSRQSVSQGANTFNVLATGGFWIFSGPYPAGVKLPANSSAWVSICDRNVKKDFAPVDGRAVLEKLAAMPIQQWHYQWEKDTDTLNIGPMAQDFKAAFYPGRDDKGISTLEFDGVELAAIQGLNQKLENETKAKDAEIQDLKQSVAELKAMVEKLAGK